jgi:hypothetical protein
MNDAWHVCCLNVCVYVFEGINFPFDVKLSTALLVRRLCSIFSCFFDT